MSDPFDSLCKHGWLWDGPCVWCKNERLRERIEELEKALRDLLMSADCTWEEKREGHDWAEACAAARRALAKIEEVE